MKNFFKNVLACIIVILSLIFITCIGMFFNKSDYDKQKCLDETNGDYEVCYGK